MFEQIPVEILEQYVGNWIVWDQDDSRVLGAAPSLEEAEKQAEGKAPQDHLLRFHHSLGDQEIAGML